MPPGAAWKPIAVVAEPDPMRLGRIAGALDDRGYITFPLESLWRAEELLAILPEVQLAVLGRTLAAGELAGMLELLEERSPGARVVVLADRLPGPRRASNILSLPPDPSAAVLAMLLREVEVPAVGSPGGARPVAGQRGWKADA